MIPCRFTHFGFPAPIYQFVYQGALVASFGSNVEAVTVVMTAFLVRLGVVSRVCGACGFRSGAQPAGAFTFVELSVAVYGFASVPFIGRTGAYAVGLPAFALLSVSQSPSEIGVERCESTLARLGAAEQITGDNARLEFGGHVLRHPQRSPAQPFWRAQ